jgi:biotin transport system substrate-specific component
MLASLYARAQNVAILQKELTQIVIGIALLFCCTQIAIPLEPVPITLQTVGVMLIGLFYPKKTAIKTILGYIALGALGLPVFSNFMGGLPFFVRPTAGYVWGFLVAVAAMTSFREKVKQETAFTMFVACLIGSAAIYAVGIAWLSLFLGPVKAIQFGLIPFIIPGFVKMLILSSAVRHIKSGRWI